MSSYREEDIKHKTGNFWVLDVGSKGYEVYQRGFTHSTKVASVGLGEGLGLPRAIEEAERRQAQRCDLIESIRHALTPHGWTATADKGGLPTFVAKKTYETAVGPRDAEVWLGDKLRRGNLCVYANYGGALDTLWLPVAAFRSEENVRAFTGLADTMVADTYAAGLSRGWSASPFPVLTGDDRSAAWGVIFGEQAVVMHPADLPSDERPRGKEFVQR